MVAELLDGPLDGAIITTRCEVPPFIILTSNGEGLLYKRVPCERCIYAHDKINYLFAGYHYECTTTKQV
jgi:hypothetical protein